MSGRLLTLGECAERTSTTLRWWRRAVFERRIAVVKIGALVRIDEHDFEDFIEVNRSPAQEHRTQSIKPRLASGARQSGRQSIRRTHGSGSG